MHGSAQSHELSPFDLVAGLARIAPLATTPAWGEPGAALGALLEVLLRTPGLAFARLTCSGVAENGTPLSIVRVAESLLGDGHGRELADAVASALRDSATSWRTQRTAVIGGCEFSIVWVELGCGGELGGVVVGSQRPNFPERAEQLFLDVVASQASSGLYRAHLLAADGGAELVNGQRRGDSGRTARALASWGASGGSLPAGRARGDEVTRAEEALRKSERESRSIIDCIPGFVAAFTPLGEVDFVNRQAFEYFGKSLEDLRHWGRDDSIHAEDLERVLGAFERSLASGDPFEVELRARRFDGVYRWFQSRGAPLRDGNGRIIRWYNLLTDIEDRKRAEVELKRAYDSFADGQRLSRTGNFTADIVADDHIWSEECYRLFDFEPTTPISVQMVRDLIHAEDLPVFDARFQQSLEGAEFDLVFRISTGRSVEKHVHAVGRLVERVAGRPLFIGALRDITENRRAEEAVNNLRSELAHVARVASLSTLTASITHEVNQPLSGVITNAGTCLKILEVAPVQVDAAREAARRILRDGKRAADVIARLRALFSKREFTLEPLDLNEAAREVIALSMSDLRRNRVVLRSELAGELPSLVGDRVQLQQVLLNLIRNGCDAMASLEGRPRMLSVKTELENPDRVRLSVRDAGPGIDRQTMDSLFEPFYTTKNGGMGMGLSVSRSIIERHHGTLWAEANDGPGACFVFSIPVHSRSEPA
jgi:PAS domain S-box-containing protein